MAFIIKDRVKEGTTTTGTGDITLNGAAATFDTFQSYMTNGDTTYYAIVHTTSGVDEWEVGIGTWNTGNTLTRTTVLAGSNGSNAENFSAGTKDVFMTYPASKAVYTDASGDIDINGGTIDGTTIGATTADTGKFTTLETTSNADIGGYLDLEVLSDHAAYKEGRIWYDSLHKTLNFYSDDSNVVHELGIEEHQRVYNNTGSTITKGSPLYFSGNYTAGTIDVPTVGLADATDVNAYNAQGLAASDIANNSYGYCIVAGQLTEVDTSGLTAGTNFFVGLTPGAVQNSSPVYPNYPMCLGWVVNSHATEGVLLVNQQNHSVNSFRVRTDAHIGDDLIVGGNLQVLGTTTTTSTSDVTAGAPFYRANEGDAIGEAGTTFSGTGLDDAFFAGHFTGTTPTTYYVKIDSVGTPDTFAVSIDDFATTISTGNAITGNEQLIHSADNISVTFGATTGHTLNDKWTGTASPILVDSGFFTNRNTGTSGVGYTHMGFFYDVSEDKWVLLDEYDPTPQGSINLAHSSTSYATLKVGSVEGNLTGDVTGDVTGNASTADSLSTSRNIGGVAFNGTADINLPGVNTTGNQDTSGNAATATALATSRTIQLTGDVTGSASFDGTANASITAVVQDDSHSHVISNVDGLQAALDGKADDTITLTAGNGLTGGGNLTANRTFTVGAGTGVTVNANDIAIGQDVATTASPTFAGATFTGNTYWGDLDTAIWGAGNDLQVYHDGNSVISSANGTLFIQNTSDDADIRFRSDNGTGGVADYIMLDGSAGAVNLYHYGSKKFNTNSSGISVTGTTLTDSLNVSNGTTILSQASDNVIRSNSDSSRVRVFGGSSASVGNGAALTLHGASQASGYADLASATSGYITFRTGTNERMRITNAGNLGVNVQSPAAKLHVDNPNTTTPSLTYGATAGQILTNEDSEFAFGLDSSSPYTLYIQGRYTTNTSRDITINPLGGQVGIGTRDPKAVLDVESQTDNKWALRVQGNTNNASGVWTGIGLAGEDANTKAGILFEDSGSTHSRGNVIIAANNTADNTTNVSVSDQVARFNRDKTTQFYGTVKIPARIEHVGDSDTYHEFDGSNSWRVVTGNIERLKITSAAIATPTSIYSNRNGNSTDGPNLLLGSTTNNSTKFHSIRARQYYSDAESEGYGLIGGAANTANNEVRIGGGLAEENASTLIRFFTAPNTTTRTGTERLTIKSDGRVGISQTSPAFGLDVGNGSSAFPSGHTLRINSSGDTIFSLSRANTSLMSFRNDSTAYTCIASNNNANLMLGHGGSGGAGAIANHLYFKSGETVVNEGGLDRDFRVESDNYEYAFKIDGGNGGVAIGYPAFTGSLNNGAGIGFFPFGYAQMVRNSDTPLALGRFGTTGNIQTFFYGTASNNQTGVGSIQVSSSGTTYNTTSDRRLKTDIEPIADGTDKLMAMKPVTHKWIADPEADAVHGFIAQEMQEVVPEAVSGEADGEEMMSMDYGRITPVLVAALQDAHKKIELLEQRLGQLENK